MVSPFDADHPRYVVFDQNGDVLFESDVWAHASRYFSEWLGVGRQENDGAGVWDNDADCWERRFVWDEEES